MEADVLPSVQGDPLIVTASTLAVFALASVALAVVPGPAVAYIVTQSVDKGRRAGVVSALGVASGGVVHIAAATVGLSALIASSATAFTVVKLVGAAYLITVGVRRILTRDPEQDEERVTAPADLRRLYLQGAVVNILNPKTALFFLAFLPQFVDADRGSVTAQVALLGVVFATIALASDAAYALLADAFAGRIRRTGRAAQARRFVTGGIFIALGVSAAVARRTG